jgi:hypothetical protein
VGGRDDAERRGESSRIKRLRREKAFCDEGGLALWLVMK